MKQLDVPLLFRLDRESPLEEVSEQLDQLEKHAINTAPWPDYPYKPSVSFAVAHSNDCFFVKFYVEEDAIRAVFRKTNDPVYRDSCVELFIAFNDERAYYNLEFNSLGSCLMAYGAGKENRRFLSEAVIREIKRYAQLSVGELPNAAVKWELTLVIPVEVFCFHGFTSLNEQTCKVNFYKCGDDLPKPHYLTWNTIKAASPNFHLPEYFGELQFL
ncbi:carbohydrate-binding family 9-like protein [Rufibacter roseolus]|uniref:carbohydrate-binding family 9-like protein n=1 Tax=Rufibacter roseolus TaxID=2817375 RepID=UPI001B316CD5|nr:carbohydrate-binding family 9-like protein [Rufibacter roseolus]